MHSLLTVKNLTIGYGQTPVVKNLNFTLGQHDFLCVVGKNGSGKSTLIKTILGLLPPIKGELFFSSNLAPTSIGYVPQATDIEPNFPASVEEIVRSGTLNQAKFCSFYRQHQREAADKAIQFLHIDTLKHSSFASLSGGEKQKVLIARALAASSKLLILDEPANNLDSKSRHELRQLLEKLRATKLAIIMITHDLDHENLIGTHILSLDHGPNFYGTVDDFVREIHHA